MERKIGEIFEFGGEWHQCLKPASCDECAFSNSNCIDYPSFKCSVDDRTDNCSVIFKKLEKVGEPYEHYEKLYQCYKLPMETKIRLLPDNCHPIGKDNLVEIEIKQNKENNMEEKKLNLKPFDIQKAREGKPVCTRDGRKVRIICFDAKDTQPIIGLYEKDIDGIVREYLCSYHMDGRMYDDLDCGYDLMMLKEKKEGWVNVYKGSVCISVYPRIYKSREEAVSDNTTVNRIDTVKIYWEE